MTEKQFNPLFAKDKHPRTRIFDVPQKPKPLPGLIPSENYPGVYYPASPYKYPVTYDPEHSSQKKVKRKGV